jgi:hypothetical protein
VKFICEGVIGFLEDKEQILEVHPVQINEDTILVSEYLECEIVPIHLNFEVEVLVAELLELVVLIDRIDFVSCAGKYGEVFLVFVAEGNFGGDLDEVEVGVGDGNGVLLAVALGCEICVEDGSFY